MRIEARPWTPQDLLDDLQEIIDEEPNRYLNTRRTTLEMALAYLEEHFSEENPKPLTIEDLLHLKGEPVWIVWPDCRIASKWWIVDSYDWHVMEFNDHFMARRYGETWIAYRNKPKEDTNHG